MKKKGNKYKVLNDSQVNLLGIFEPEIIPQYEINYFCNHTFSGKQYQNMMHNSFLLLLTKTPIKDISTEFTKQQFEHIFLYFLNINIVNLTYNDKYILFFDCRSQHNLAGSSIPIIEKYTFKIIINKSITGPDIQQLANTTWPPSDLI